MTKEPIMIDDVDVKDCKRRIGKDNFCRYYKRPCAENNYNCIWKKYLRKEQECEELLKFNNSLVEEHKTIGNDLYKEIKDYRIKLKAKEQECDQLRGGQRDQNKVIKELKAENEKMSKGYIELTEIVSPYIDDFTGYNEELKGFDIVLCVKELMEQLNDKDNTRVTLLVAINDQLKKENEELKKQACGLRPELKYIINEICRKYNINGKYYHEKIVEIINNLDEYAQTLTEIKEIVQNKLSLVCKDCLLKQCKTCEAKQILQKCEDVL